MLILYCNIFFLLIFCLRRVSSQGLDCTGLPDNDQIQGRLKSHFNDINDSEGSASASLNAVYATCLAQGNSVGTYREYSVVVDYDTNSESNVIRLFDLQCVLESPSFPPSWFQNGLSNVDPGFQFMNVEPRINCSGCSAGSGNEYNCQGIGREELQY